MLKDKRITFRIEENLRAEAEAKAKAEGRSLANWIRYIILKALDKVVE